MKQLAWVLLVVVAGAIGSTVLSGTARPLSVQAQGAPTVKVTAPANGATVSNPVTIRVTTSGAVIKAAADNDPNASHLHYFVDRDPATVLQQGQPIPSGQPDIIHTADTTEELPALAPGRHTVWVVLAHTDHTPFNPNVEDQVSFVVGGGAQAAPGAAPQMPVTGRGGLLGPKPPAQGVTGHLQSAAADAGSVGNAGFALLCVVAVAVAAIVWAGRRRPAGRR